MTISWRPLLLAFTLLIFDWTSIASAQEFLEDEGHLFVDKTVKRRTIGIEIEYYGVTTEASAQLIQEVFGAHLLQQTPTEWQFISPYGRIALKIEGQAWRYEDNPEEYARQLSRDIVEAPREIVLPPLHYNDMDQVQKLADRLKSAGAQGTEGKNPVSLQVNLQMASIENSQKAVDDLVNLMRVYFQPKHQAQADKLLVVPEVRKEYIRDPTPGFLRRLYQASYRPTARELFDDYLYRQSLELRGDRQAWTMPIEQARSKLMAMGDQAVSSEIVKMVKIRISSLLLQAFPRDPLTKKIVADGWARPAPIVEFREYNNDFNVMQVVNWSMGITRAAQIYGPYDHDKLISEITGIAPKDLVRLREQGPVVRYVLQSPQIPLTRNEREELEKNSPQTAIIQLDPNHTGARPLRLGEESIVWNRRHIHRDTLIGEFNPGLENYLIQQALENKIFEAKIFGLYAPQALPRSTTLAEVLGGKTQAPLQIVRRLNQEFPKGWVLKGAWDLGTEKSLISDQLDFKKMMAQYEDGFEEHRRSVLRKHKGSDPEEIMYFLKKHPGYRGWVIRRLMVHPELVLVQERRQLMAEFRVEVLGGRVLGQDSTIERYGYLNKKGSSFPQAQLSQLALEAETFIQNLVNRLPPELAILPFGFDAAKTAEGDWIVIESNAGGNSSFLEENPASSLALRENLGEYPSRIQGTQGLLKPDAQMLWIRNHWAKFHMSPRLYYKGIHLLDHDMQDPEYQRRPMPKPARCRQILNRN